MADFHMHLDPAFPPPDPLPFGQDGMILANGTRESCEVCKEKQTPKKTVKQPIA